MSKFVIFFIAYILCGCYEDIYAARILAIVPIASISHQTPHRPLFKALTERGHEIIVVTPNPLRDSSLKNYTEIDMTQLYTYIRELDFFHARYVNMTWIGFINNYFTQMNRKAMEYIFSHVEMRKIFANDSSETFDVVLAEICYTPAVFALAHRFNAPLIGLTSLGFSMFNNYLAGLPILPSHPSSWDMEYRADYNLTFWERLKNYIIGWHHVWLVMNNLYRDNDEIVKKYLGTNYPTVAELQANMSVVFLQQDYTVSFPRPVNPNIIPFAYTHIEKEHAPLPHDVTEFLNDTSSGFIYVSFGTNTQMSSLKSEHIKIFFDVFSNLSCKVLWKSNIESTREFKKLLIKKWFPQQSILAHPNIRMFIYQGGIQSSQEAVYYNVPLLGIPIFADQEKQVHRMVHLGVAKKINFFQLSTEHLHSSIEEVLKTDSYKINMHRLSKIAKDKPVNTVANLVWWTEYVIRHKGVPHLKSSLIDEPWYQRFDVDVIGFLGIMVFIIFVCLLFIAFYILTFLIKLFTLCRNSKKEKMP